MRLSVRFTTLAAVVTILAGGTHAHSERGRQQFPVPTLTDVRDILAQLEWPIISNVVNRYFVPVIPKLYGNNSDAPLQRYLKQEEITARLLGRYSYGQLEYPYEINGPAPDSNGTLFKPGTFHEDGKSSNPALLTFYTTTVLPLIAQTPTRPFYFHLANESNADGDAALEADVNILQLISHRVHIGKTVAESKYAGDVALYTPLIHSGNSTALRALVTNTTQEQVVLTQADQAVNATVQAVIASGEIVPPGLLAAARSVVAKLFRELIDETTLVEIDYLLARL